MSRDSTSGTTSLNIPNVGSTTSTTAILSTTFDQLNIGAQRAASPANKHDGSVTLATVSNSVRSDNFGNTMYYAWNTSTFISVNSTEISASNVSIQTMLFMFM